MTDALFKNVDCVMLKVDDLEAALEFYRDKLGHKLVWRTDKHAGLSFGDGVTELVLADQVKRISRSNRRSRLLTGSQPREDPFLQGLSISR